MGRLLKVFIKNCSCCKENFGCVTNGVDKECASCDFKNSQACNKHLASNTSHGICTEECFLSSLPVEQAKRYMEAAIQ